jgi:cell division protein FtsW (lipid II flippase)
MTVFWLIALAIAAYVVLKADEKKGADWPLFCYVVILVLLAFVPVAWI